MPTKYKVFLDENGQISTKSRIEPIDANMEFAKDWKMTPELLGSLKEVQDEQFKVYDPETREIIDVRSSDASVRSARMRHALQINPYKALSNGFFAGEPIDSDGNDNFVFNLLRETARTPTKMVVNAPSNVDLMFGDNEGAFLTFNVDEQEVESEFSSYRDALIDAIRVNNEKIDKKFGKQREGFASDLGSGIGSLGTVVAMSALGSAAGPIGTIAAGTAATAMFGVDAGASAYQEALEAGVKDNEAWNMGAAVGASNAILERVGLGLLWKSAGKKLASRAIHGFMTEFSEEMSQGITEDVIMQKVRGKSVKDILADGVYQGLIGGIVGAGAGIVGGGNLNELKSELVERGLTEQQADTLINKTAEIVSNKDIRNEAIKDTLQGQVEQARFMNENFDELFPTVNSITDDAITAARQDTDIREDIKSRMIGVDEQKQNIVADLIQSFADKAAEDFGHTQREILEKTGLQIRMEEQIESKAPVEENVRINENGELVDNNGNVLFQRVGVNGATEGEKNALNQAQAMEAEGFDNDSIKKSTGWSRGLDNKWWLETGGAYKYKLDALALPKSSEKLSHVKIPITSVIETDNYQRYPELQNIVITFVNRPNSNTRGYYNPKTNELELNLGKIGANPVQLVKTLAHEIDHYIASREGFESGSTMDPKYAEKAVAKQVARHEKRLLKSLKELDLIEDYNSFLSENETATHVEAVEYAISNKYTQEDFVGKLKKQLQNIIVDAFIIDRYGNLDKLDVKEKQQRIQQAYTNTIGEIYARRASNAVGFDDASLREIPDEASGNAGELVSSIASVSEEAQDAIIEGLNEFAVELQQDTQHRFYQSAFAGSRIDYNQPSLEAIGSGEGVQAHGWGLYYALNKDIAEKYRQNFVKNNYDLFVGGEKLPKSLLNVLSGNAIYNAINGDMTLLKDGVSRVVKEWEKGDQLFQKIIKQGNLLIEYIENNPKTSISSLEEYSKAQFGDDHYRWHNMVKRAKTVAQQENRKNTIQDVKNSIQSHIEPFESVEKTHKEIAEEVIKKGVDTLEIKPQVGQLHEVNIPESPFLIDEQLEFEKQSEYVQNILLNKVFPEVFASELNGTSDINSIIKLLTQKELSSLSGGDIYTVLEKKLGSDKAASEVLVKHGIKGISYVGALDGRCFVIFSADDVNVIQKFYDQNDGEVRGYFDWTDKMHQIIQIMKTGDLDTVIHELGHFFSVNYINMAIESNKLDNVKPLIDYYKVSNVSDLVTREDIQEDLAVKFISYIKTDQSPRGFRKYFDACKDWLISAWEKLKSGGFVQEEEIPDEIVRFFDNITIRKPKNINLDSVQREKTRLKQILKDARVGKLQGVSDSDIYTIEELMKAATARIPRMPKSLYTKLWGHLNTRFAESHDLAALMGVDDKYKHLMTRKTGGISNENDLLDFLREEGFIFGEGWDNNAQQDMAVWDEAMRLLSDARNQYSVQDSQRVEEIRQLTEAKEAARDILEGQDSYDALGWLDGAKTALQRVNDAEKTARMRQTVLEQEYSQMSAKLRRAKNNTSELRAAFKSAVNFLAAQDLPTDVKNNLYKTVHQVHDTRSLAKWMQDVREKAGDIYSAQINKAQREKIKNELSETYSRNKRNIKYDYENNKLFSELREFIRMKTEDAQKKLMSEYYMGDLKSLSRQDELRKMMLEYVANDGRRGGMSAEFMDELISRIQEAKLIGKDALDEIQFERGIERLELHEEVLDAITSNKPGKMSKMYINWVANWKSMLNTITNKKISEQFDMIPKQARSSIESERKLTETMSEVLNIYNIVPKNDTKRNYEFMKWREEMTKPIEGLRVWYVDHNNKKVYYEEEGANIISRDNIVNMYNQYKDPKSKELMDIFYGSDQIQQLFSYLTDKDKTYADYLMERVGENYHDLNSVYVQLYQKDMPRKAIYWPRRSNHETDHEMMEMFDGNAREPNFTKSRSHGSVPVFWMGAWDVYTKHEKDSQYMINESLTYKQIADTFGHSTVQNAIKSKFGKEAVNELNSQISALSLGGLRKVRVEAESIFNDIVGQIAGAKVFLSPFVMLKQLTSFGGYSAYMSTPLFYKDFALGILNPVKTYKFMMEHAGDFIKNRFTKGNNETLSAMIDALKPRLMDRAIGTAKRVSFNKFLSLLVRTGDLGAVIYGGYPRLKALLEEKNSEGNLKYSHDEAVQQFLIETEEAQQSSQQAALSNFQRNGNLKVLAMFKNSQAQFLRKIVDAKKMMERGEITRGQFAKVTAIFGGQMAVLYWLAGEFLNGLAYGDDDDDKNDDGLDMVWGCAGSIATSIFDAIPIFGNIASATLNYATGSYHKIGLSIVGVDDIMQSLKNLSDYANSSKKRNNADVYFWVQTISPLIESTTGFPVSRYNRVMKKTGAYETLGI